MEKVRRTWLRLILSDFLLFIIIYSFMNSGFLVDDDFLADYKDVNISKATQGTNQNWANETYLLPSSIPPHFASQDLLQVPQMDFRGTYVTI